MPRIKTLARKLDDVASSQLSWNLSEKTDLIDDFLPIPLQLNLEDTVDYTPPIKKIRVSKTNYQNLLTPQLRELIDQHDYYVTIGKKLKSFHRHCACLLGEFEVILEKSKAPYQLPNHAEFWLYVNEDCVSKCFLYFEQKERAEKPFWAQYYPIQYLPPNHVMASFRGKQTFILTINSYDGWTRVLKVDVGLKDTAVMKLQFPSEAPRLKPNTHIQNAIEYLCKIPPPRFESPKKSRHDIDALYSAVKRLRSEVEIPEYDVQHSDLVPTLREYQIEAVRWMLQREICNENDDEGDLHQLYQTLQTVDRQTFFYNRFGGYMVKEKPICANPKPGGILADEMGLGKTVEVLACVLCHPRDDEKNIKFHPNSNGMGINDIDLDSSSDVDDDTYSANATSMSSLTGNASSWSSLESWSKPTTSSTMSKETSSSKRNSKSNVTVGQKELFECICGAYEKVTGGVGQIQCTNCGLWQHKNCIYFDSAYGEYCCSHCWVAKPPVSSRATLIICPASIRNQWNEEIERHTKITSLQIYEYSGIHKFGFIQPPKLADNDLVITTYEILRRELNYVDLPHCNSANGRRLRHPKRFMAVPSPLTAIEWWRVCLDEAQMVESVTTKTADMAMRLSAVNRWCITGTPIQKSIEDLYGLLLFLGAEPFSVKAWWREVLFEPYCHGDFKPMHDFISKFLWRTMKVDVLDQIGLPEQNQEIHWLCFTPVEEHFYRQQHIDCSRDAVARFKSVTNLDVKLNSLDRKTLSKLLAPLLRLRQACCHPQAVRGQFISAHKSTLTMEELLASLIKKTKVEAEEAHRQHTASLNGLAGLHIIKTEWIEAAEKYREVLRLADEHSESIKTDKLQRLHALNNLSELLDAGHANMPLTLRDDSLKSDADSLRKQYLTKCTNKVDQAREALQTTKKNVADIVEIFNNTRSCWWVECLNNLERTDHVEELMERIRTDLLATCPPNRTCLAHRFRDLQGLKYVVINQLDSLDSSHDQLVKAVETLCSAPSEKDVNDAVECHLRPAEKKRRKCTYCKIHELFNVYEGRLFSFSQEDEEKFADTDKDDDGLLGPLRRGTWAGSDVEKILKLIYQFSKSHNAYSSTSGEELPLHLRLLDALKKEFRALRGVWMQVCDHVAALDELNMATIRLRVRLADEPKPNTTQLNILEPHEVERHRFKLASEQIVSENEKKKKLGQLLYLKHLAKSSFGKGKGINPDPCPICQKELGEQWSVLQCGHCFCVECIRIIVNHSMIRGRLRSVKCAICRQMTTAGDVSYVNTKGEESEDEQQFSVKGSYSTKVEAIIRTLIKIHSKDPTAKALVFSTWQNMLDVIARALTENDIEFRSLSTHATFQANLTSFKHDDDVRVLLLPVQSGANGLNLIEATHVLLVEPILNPASELQAIGRIHRIGQTKPTVVHKFLVRNTIEERMDAMLKSHCSGSSSHVSEENTLTIDDLRKLFDDDEL